MKKILILERRKDGHHAVISERGNVLGVIADFDFKDYVRRCEEKLPFSGLPSSAGFASQAVRADKTGVKP